MLSKCANPSCSNHFLYLHEGKLFRLDVGVDPGSNSDFQEQQRRVEFFWLCESCAANMTVVFTRGKGVKVRPFRSMRQAAS